jgi:tetratricopeptide (TPR) repeat protein
MRGGFEMGHVMLLRGATITLWLMASWAFGHDQALAQQALAEPACTVAAFETQPEATVTACTAVLDKSGLSDAERAGTLKIRARSLHTTGRLDDAIKDYDTALLLAPNDPELHLRRGWTAYDKADFKTVLDQANAAIKLKPDYADAYDLVGAMLSRREIGRQHEAMAVFAEAIRLNPNDPLFHIHLMDVSECCGMPEEALREADAVLRLPVAAITKPNSIVHYFKRASFRTVASLERARMLAVLGRNDEAKQAYDRAVHDDPGALTYAGRAAFLLEQVQAPLDEVQADLDKSLAADANIWFSHGLAARVQFYRKNYAAAETEFARSLAIYPINGEMRWWHAMTLRLLDRGDEAAEEAVTAFRVDPGFMFGKVRTLQKLGLLPTLSSDSDQMPAIYDAARACMLDEHCS